MLAFIFAVKEMVDTAKADGIKGLPLNICFIFEGGCLCRIRVERWGAS
jgi:hypothetical protein